MRFLCETIPFAMSLNHRQHPSPCAQFHRRRWCWFRNVVLVGKGWSDGRGARYGRCSEWTWDQPNGELTYHPPPSMCHLGVQTHGKQSTCPLGAHSLGRQSARSNPEGHGASRAREVAPSLLGPLGGSSGLATRTRGSSAQRSAERGQHVRHGLTRLTHRV